jgi:hypothetical protein
MSLTKKRYVEDMAQRLLCFHDPESSECTSYTLAEANEAADRNYAGFRASAGSSSSTALVLMRKESLEVEPLDRIRETWARASCHHAQQLAPGTQLMRISFSGRHLEREDETTWGPE